MASSQDEHILFDLLLNKHWDEAMLIVNTEEGREELRMNDEIGRLPLHRACLYRAPLELVEAMIGGYPESVRVTGHGGFLPIHLACMSGESPRVVRLLLDAYPEGAKVADEDGSLPLHHACFNEASADVLAMLIDAHPEAVTTVDGLDDRLPLHHLVEFDEASPDKKEVVEKVELLLRPLLTDEEARHCPHPLTDETPLHIGAEFDLLELRTCLQIPRCPAEVIATVAERHPEQLREIGEDGSLPLHLAAANPNLNGVLGVLDGQEDLITKLVRLYPDAAAAADGEGRSPLNLAIESGKRWTEGVEAIVDAAGHVMTRKDVGTNLYPFMLAASGVDPCMTTVFKLLRGCPMICNISTNRKKSIVSQIWNLVERVLRVGIVLLPWLGVPVAIFLQQLQHLMWKIFGYVQRSCRKMQKND